MGMDRFMFGLLYRLGYTPWDGHGLPPIFTAFVEGANHESPQSPGNVLDVGCGTGDVAIYLAQHGWTVTAMDFVEVALNKARAKAKAAGASVRFLQGDATRLSSYSLGMFPLVVDGGCMHGFSDSDRDTYVRELEKTVAPGGHFFLFTFDEAKRSRPPRGMSQPEVQRRFPAPAWELVSTGIDPSSSLDPSSPLHIYHLRRS